MAGMTEGSQPPPAAPAVSDPDSFDLVVLGAGSGGYACALRAAQLGQRVALVEKDLVGGTCLHRGCIPTKAILHAAEVADVARDGEQFGIHATVERIDPVQVLAYSDSVVSRLYKGLTGLIASPKLAGAPAIEVVQGTGRLERCGDALTVRVGERALSAPDVVLASGSYARTLPGIEINGTSIITSDHALRMDHLPGKAIVLGGGVVGVELASAWRSFGVDITIIEALPRLVPNEDPALSTALERAFRRRKIDIRTGWPVSSVSTDGTAVSVTLTNRDSGGNENSEQLRGDVLLVAVGRGPSTDRLGFAEAGVTLDRGFVVTDERLRTSVPGVWAVGDIVPGLQLAHRGFGHGIFVAEEIAHAAGRYHPAPVPIVDAFVPRVTYSQPEIASVGLTEVQARETYGEVETLTYDLGGNGKSQILKTQGFVKLVRAPQGAVVGVHMIGARVGELVGEAQLITGWDAFPSDVAGLVHAHPTQNEALGEAHLALAGKPLHSHG